MQSQIHLTIAAAVHRDGHYLMMTEIVDCLQVLVLNQPAGHVEPEESALEAVQRETLEETGWQVNLEGQALQAATPAASRSPNRSTGIGML